MTTRQIAPFAGLAFAACFVAAQAHAQDAGLRRGADAFGSWRDDAPGVTRLITAADIAAAAAEKGSSSNGSSVVPPPKGAALSVKPGFVVEQVANLGNTARAITFAPNGDLFLAQSFGGAIGVMRFAEDGSILDEARFADGLDQPYGMAFYPPTDPQWLYVATTNGLVRYPYDGGLKAAGPVEILFDDIPGGGHWTRSIGFSNDGESLFYSVGSQSNVAQGMGATPPGGIAEWEAKTGPGAAWGDEEGRALVLAMSPDGSNRRVYATGLRNCSGLAVQRETGKPWCAVNERDGLGNNIPFDYVTSVSEGGYYGWPWYFIGANPDPRWNNARPDLADKVSVPDVLLQSHSAPLDLAFFDSDAWGAEYEGDVFVALHGSWNRNPRTGYKLVRIDVENGAATGEYEDFVTGFVIDDKAVWGRPVGVAVSPDGDLYFSEDGNQTLWRVRKR